MNKIIVRTEKGDIEFGNLDHVEIRQSRLPVIHRDRRGFVKKFVPGRTTTTSIVAVSWRTS